MIYQSDKEYKLDLENTDNEYKLDLENNKYKLDSGTVEMRPYSSITAALQA